MPGYSPNPLYKKLGLKEGFTVQLINPPAHYKNLIPEMEGKLFFKKKAGETDFIHFFTNSVSELQTELPALKKTIKKNGTIWISWYKKAAKKETELTEDLVRKIALDTGLVDVKVCAVDDSWSGLKLVFRLADR